MFLLIEYFHSFHFQLNSSSIKLVMFTTCFSFSSYKRKQESIPGKKKFVFLCPIKVSNTCQQHIRTKFCPCSKFNLLHIMFVTAGSKLVWLMIADKHSSILLCPPLPLLPLYRHSWTKISSGLRGEGADSQNTAIRARHNFPCETKQLCQWATKEYQEQTVTLLLLDGVLSRAECADGE